MLKRCLLDCRPKRLFRTSTSHSIRYITCPLKCARYDASHSRQSILATRQRHRPKNSGAAQEGILLPSLCRQGGRRAAAAVVGTERSYSRLRRCVAKLSAVYQPTRGRGPTTISAALDRLAARIVSSRHANHQCFHSRRRDHSRQTSHVEFGPSTSMIESERDWSRTVQIHDTQRPDPATTTPVTPSLLPLTK